MDDYVIVLNAGSSSLKFSLYCRPESGSWGLGARGQIEGIGTSPQFSAKSGSGERLADQALDKTTVRDGRGALDSLAKWLRSTYGGARVLGVGHRVVHGGARFSGPTLITPQVLAELKKLIPLAPLHQPHNLAPIRILAQLRRRLAEDWPARHGVAAAASAVRTSHLWRSASVRAVSLRL